jgi:hypothetical protein
MEKDPAKRKHRCHLRHQEDEGEIIGTKNEIGHLVIFRRYYCIFCGDHMGDDVIKKP